VPNGRFRNHRRSSYSLASLSTLGVKKREREDGGVTVYALAAFQLISRRIAHTFLPTRGKKEKRGGGGEEKKNSEQM